MKRTVEILHSLGSMHRTLQQLFVYGRCRSRVAFPFLHTSAALQTQPQPHMRASMSQLQTGLTNHRHRAAPVPTSASADSRLPRATPKSLLGRRGAPVPPSSASGTAPTREFQSVPSDQTARPRQLFVFRQIFDQQVSILTCEACQGSVRARDGSQTPATGCWLKP